MGDEEDSAKTASNKDTECGENTKHDKDTADKTRDNKHNKNTEDCEHGYMTKESEDTQM